MTAKVTSVRSGVAHVEVDGKDLCVVWPGNIPLPESGTAITFRAERDAHGNLTHGTHRPGNEEDQADEAVPKPTGEAAPEPQPESAPEDVAQSEPEPEPGADAPPAGGKKKRK